MPVPGRNNRRYEGLKDSDIIIKNGHDPIPIRNGQGSSRTKIVMNIRDEKSG